MADTASMEDLGDFMEMVTVYKCKFCDFTTNTIPGMAAHVKLSHLKTSPQVPGVQTASLPTVSIPSQPLSVPQLNGPNPSQSIAIPQLEGPNLSQQITIPQQPLAIPQLDGPNTSQPIEIHQLDGPNNLSQSNTQTILSRPQVLLNVDNISSNIQQNEINSQENKPNHVSYAAGHQIVQLNGTGSLQQVIVGSMSEPCSSVQLLPGNAIPIDSSTDMLDTIQNTANDQSLGGIQIMKENAEGQLVAANCGHVQLGDGSTVQVLVYDSNTHQSADPQSEIGALINEDVDGSAKDSDQQMVLKQESQVDEENQLHFVINADNQLYREPDENSDNFTRITNEETDADIEASVKEEDIELGEDGASKELYLCGSCSTGFATIQECKVHMIQEHSLNKPETLGRVDTGTQMEPKKKVGRKKKSEQVQEEPKEEEKITLSDSDEDWSERLHSYGSRSKRNRRPPSTLTKDYYLGRSKVKSQKRPIEDQDPSCPPLPWKKSNANKCGLNGCSLKFWDDKSLESHRECHIPNSSVNREQFRCLGCEQTFHGWKRARHHMWKSHNIEIDLVSCDICNEFKTDALHKLKIHRQIHGNDRLYICTICGKGFKQFAQMRNHEVCHSELNAAVDPEQADKWHTPKVCDICGRTLANVKCLKMHIKTVHSKFKQYKCSYCNHTCARKAMLIIHQRIHTGEKPFQCDQCAYSCGDHNSLRRHKMRHSGTKPYKCPHCSYACIQAISLKVHIKNKHPGLGGVFNCHMCLYRTVNKLQYDNHMLDHKHGLIETIVNPDGQVMYKNVNHTKRPRVSAVSTVKQDITTVALQTDLLETLQTQSVQMQNILQPQVIQISAPTNSPNTDPVGQLQMQVQMNEAGESVISADDLAKLTNYEGMVNSDVQAAQLIYSALSAISQNSEGNQEAVNQGVVAGVENGDIQTSIQTDNSEEGVTTHTITFHLPEGEEITDNVAVQSDVVNKNVTILKVNENGTDWPVNTVMLEQAEVQNS